MKDPIDVNVNVNVNVTQDENLEPEQEEIQEPLEAAVARFEMFCLNRLELDKGLLTLSTAGIGFSVAYLMGDKISSYLQFGLLLASVLSFGTCIGLILYIFKANSDYLSAEAEETNAKEKSLNRLDFWAAFSFVLAIGLVAAVAVMISTSQLQKRLKKPLDSETHKITITATALQSDKELPLVIKIDRPDSKSLASTKEAETVVKEDASKTVSEAVSTVNEE